MGLLPRNLWIFIEDESANNQALQMYAIFITFTHEFWHYLRKCKYQTIGDAHLIKTPPNELHNTAEGGKLLNAYYMVEE